MLRTKVMGRVGKTTTMAVLSMSAVVAACSSSPPDAERPTAPEATASSFQAMTGTSCQARDLATHASSVNANASTFFAIDTNGTVNGWGYNDFPFPLGKLLAGMQVYRPKPIGIPAAGMTATATKLAAHEGGVCAIMSDTTVMCAGQTLGFTTATAPSDMDPAKQVTLEGIDGSPPLTGAVGITAGDKHVCIWKADKTAWCWGDDHKGQLGEGNYDRMVSSLGDATGVPVEMLKADRTPYTDIEQIVAAGNTTCVRHTAGNVECVGGNGNGELGLAGGATTETITGILGPINVPAGTVFESLFGGGAGTFCASIAGSAAPQRTVCWGLNTQGQALVTTTNAPAGPSTASATDFRSTWEQGALNGCEVTAAGQLSCWGQNLSGAIPGTPSQATALGNHVVTLAPSATPITNVIHAAVGAHSMCALTTGNLYCWGENSEGEVGNNISSASENPYDVRLSVPALSCPPSFCGTMTNACGELHPCTPCSALQKCGPANTCIDDPSSCSPACGAGDALSSLSCSAHTCKATCSTLPISASNPATVHLKLDSYGLSIFADSPASYSSAGCNGFLVEYDTTVQPFTGDTVAAWPTNAVSQADCPNTRVSYAIYDTSGKVLVPVKTATGAWNAARARCDLQVGNDPVPVTANKLIRVVARAERGTQAKGTTTWGGIPVHVSVAGKY